MSLDTGNQFDETGTSTADFDPQNSVLPNSTVLSSDVNQIAERAIRRTRLMYDGGPFPKGITATQSTTDGNGVTATGNGTGAGIRATGGSGSGIGGDFIGGATGGVGVSAQGTGSGFGLGAIGGTTGFGLLGQAGGGNQPGVKAQGAGTGPDIECLTGPILFSGTQPAKTADPGANRAHATNIAKVWGYVTTDGIGGYTILDGFNVASVTLNAGHLRINFARAFASTSYAATGGEDSGGAFTVNPRMSTSTTGYVELIVKNATTGATVDPTANAIGITFNIMGRH